MTFNREYILIAPVEVQDLLVQASIRHRIFKDLEWTFEDVVVTDFTLDTRSRGVQETTLTRSELGSSRQD
jgi:hypothetical protein